MLGLWHRLLAQTKVGYIVADVIPPDAGAITDVTALLRYAATNGFFTAALWGLVRTAVSPYSRLRSRIGVMRYTQSAFLRKLETAGFTAERMVRNLEHNPARMTFRARPI